MSNNDNYTITVEQDEVFSISAFGYTLSLSKITERFTSLEQIQDYYGEDTNDADGTEDTENTGHTDTTGTPTESVEKATFVFDEPEDRKFTEDDRHVGAYLADAGNESGQYDVTLLSDLVIVVDGMGVEHAVIQAIKETDPEDLTEVENPVPVYNHLTGEDFEVEIPSEILDSIHEVGAVANERDETPDGRDVNQYLGQTVGNGDVNEYLGEADD